MCKCVYNKDDNIHMKREMEGYEYLGFLTRGLSNFKVINILKYSHLSNDVAGILCFLREIRLFHKRMDKVSYRIDTHMVYHKSFSPQKKLEL